MRQLPRLTNLGLLGPKGAWTQRVAAQLADEARLRKARVHPIAVLVALRAARAQGLSPGRAAAEVAAALGRPRREVYALALEADEP